MSKTVGWVVFGVAMAALGWFGRQLVPSGAQTHASKGEETVSVAVTTAMEKSIQFIPPDAPPAVKWQPVVMPRLEFPTMTELTRDWFVKR